MRACLLAVCLLAAVLASQAAGDCSWTAPTGDKFDLSSLTGKIVTGNDNKGYDYKMNPCGTVAGSKAMVQQGTEDGDAYNIALWGNGDGQPTWALIDSENAKAGIRMSFTNGDTCWPQMQRTANVDFQCDTADGAKMLVSEESGCVFNIVYSAKAACPGASGGGGSGKKSGGLSGGWVFIIILLVTSFVYVVAGCFMKRRKGAVGMEACPQVDMWRSLMTNFKAGCRYSWNMVRTGCKSGSSQQYDEL